MSTSTSSPMVQAPRRRWRWWRVALVLLALAIAVPLGLLGYSIYTTRHAWDNAEKDAALDLPRWRLMELEEDRPKIPEAENSAFVMIAARKKAAGVHVSAAPNYEEIFEKLTPTAQLNQQQIKLIETELAKIPGPLAEARKLKDMPRGRIPIKFSDDFIATLIPDHQNVRTMADWLQHDAMLLAQDEEYDQAVASCRAMLNAGRVFDGDPFLISLLIRIAMQQIAMSTLERVLAQGQASEESLREIQAVLDKEMRSSGWLAAVRGERAGFHLLFDNIRTGKVEASWLTKMGFATGAGSLEQAGMWVADRFPTTLLKYYPELLQHMNRTVQAAKLPEQERLAKIKELEAETRATGNPLIRMLVPGLQKVSDAELRSQAMLRATMAAVACERYRLKAKDNAWPASLDDLVKAKLLDAIPLDPFDGKPIRYVRTKEGIVVYSIGQDRVDNGGNIDRDHPIDPGVDIGFRLWNVDRRRQPPLPPVALPEKD